MTARESDPWPETRRWPSWALLFSADIFRRRRHFPFASKIVWVFFYQTVSFEKHLVLAFASCVLWRVLNSAVSLAVHLAPIKMMMFARWRCCSLSAPDYMSRPLLRCLFGEYWFHISRYVYDGNRSFASILRQSPWSLLYDVYWLVTMMMVEQLQWVLEQVTGNG
jgi:hypothetical protein